MWRWKFVSKFETTGIITTNVYKVSPEQKEQLDLLAEERLQKAREEAIPNILKRYEQRQEEIRQLKDSSKK
jgi:hypothetical protein